MSYHQASDALRLLAGEALAAFRAEQPWPGQRRQQMSQSPLLDQFVSGCADLGPIGQIATGSHFGVSHDFGGYTSSGGPDLIVTRLVNDGQRRVAASGLSVLDDRVSETTVEAFGQLVENLRAGASTQRYRFGLRGVTLTDLDEADVGIGVLRSLTAADVAEINFEATPWPAEVGEVCLEVETTTHWFVGEDEGTSPSGPGLGIHETLAVLLLIGGCTNREGNRRCSSMVWNRSSPYFCEGGSGGGFNPDLIWRQPGSAFEGCVDADVAQRIKQYAQLLDEQAQRALLMTCRRLARAGEVHLRSREDRLVDACIAWEALLGPRNNDQLSLQLCLSLAWLLHPQDASARTTLFSEAKKIYSMRSKIVHGSNADQKLAEENANILLDWLSEALLLLLSDRRSLLEDRDRTRTLYLGDDLGLDEASDTGEQRDSQSATATHGRVRRILLTVLRRR